MDRRTLIASGLTLGAVGSRTALAQSAAEPERIPLWPGIPPGGEGLDVKDVIIPRSTTPGDIAWTSVGMPMLTVSRPAQPNGAAVLLCPGGGYVRIATGRGPSALGRMFAARGVAAFELLYRLPHDKWRGGPDTPLQDAQRAMRIIKAGASKWSLDPERVAVIGFSAGGHVAGSLGERFDAKVYESIDAADRLSAKPIACGMFFPVVSMQPEIAHGQSRRELLGEAPSEGTARKYSLELNVPATMPPTFVCHSSDDTTVKPANSFAMFQALQAAKIPSELAIGERGGHGVPLLPGGKPHLWFELFTTMAARHGWLGATKPA